ncbi:MAG: CpsB/CapC family capsule biosynthesis tyrosine phosphatase [Oscillospiraceae bacterium]
MLDIHTHILPAMDDGARDSAQALSMLEQLAEQGMTSVALTPHFYTQEESAAQFLERRRRSVAMLRPLLHAGCPEVLLGAEVYLTRYLLANEELSDLCIGHSCYMLVELPMRDSLSNEMLELLKVLIYEREIIPVLAHVERYRDFLSRTDIVGFLTAAGCQFQSDADALLGLLGGRTIHMMQTHGVYYLGSDCHGTDRPPRMGEAMAALLHKSPQLHEKIQRHAQRMLTAAGEGQMRETCASQP